MIKTRKESMNTYQMKSGITSTTGCGSINPSSFRARRRAKSGHKESVAWTVRLRITIAIRGYFCFANVVAEVITKPADAKGPEENAAEYKY